MKARGGNDMSHPLTNTRIKMKRPNLLLRVSLAVALATAAATTCADTTLAGGDDLVNAPDTSNDIDVRQYLYGDIIYNYYVGNYYKAINGILLAKSQGHIDDKTGETELLLGDIYTRINMPRYAEDVFSHIINRDTLTSTKQQTWLSKGELYYHQGQYEQALRILEVPRDTLTIEQDIKRRVDLSNIYMAEGNIEKAGAILKDIPLNSSSNVSAYAYYNAGVANLRGNHAAEGLVLLDAVMRLPVGDDEINALKDKAALAMGFHFLQHQLPDKARDVLLNIRIDGPFSNPALLALGYVHYSRGDYKKALAFWLELLKHNPADPAVLEAMMLAPRAYEELKAYPQAVFGYRLAAQTYRAQLKQLEQIAYDSQQDGWLERLDVNARDISRDPLSTVDTVSTGATHEAAFLYKLFAQHRFNEAYQEYLQLRNLDLEMDRQAQSAAALTQLAKLHQVSIETHVHGWRRQMDDFAKKNDVLQARYASLKERMHGYSDQASFTDSASYDDMARLKRLHRLEQGIESLPNTPYNATLRERLHRVKGVILWQIANNAPLAFEQTRLEMAEMDDEMHVLAARIDGMKHLLKESDDSLRSDVEKRLATAGGKLGISRDGLRAARAADAQKLQKMTVDSLTSERTLLNTQLAEALLAVARLQDAASSKELEDNQTPKAP